MQARTLRKMVRGGATLVGLVAGLPLFPLSLAAAFTLRNEDMPEGLVALTTPILLIPLVVHAAVCPRRGGQLMVLAALISAGAFLWSLVGSTGTTLTQVVAMMGVYLAISAIGIAFWWSGASLASAKGRTTEVEEAWTD